MTTTPHAVNRLAAAIETSGLVAPDDHVLVAVSGGADSMALLHALVSSGRAVTVAHFEHGIRDTHREREHTEAFCAARGIACRCGGGDAPARARERGESLEEAARELRYEFLEDGADRAGADVIATAHTLDDHIETVLMRIMVGSGLRGLCGIPRRRGRIVRPFLGVRRIEVEAYCAVHGIDFVVDPTNADTRFARNHVRHRVLPALRASNADTDRRLIAVSDGARRRLDAMRAVTVPVVARHFLRESSDRWVLHLEDTARLDDAHLIVLLADVVTDEMGGTAARCHYEALVRLVRACDATGESVSLPGLSVRREHDGLAFTRSPSHTRGATRAEPVRAAELALPGSTTLPGARVRIDIVDRAAFDGDRGTRAESGGDAPTTVAYFDGQSIVPPLRARRWRRGDRMVPFGMNGTKKLSDIFIDRKVPRRHRREAWVVEDALGIVWLVGITTRESTRVTGSTASIIRGAFTSTPSDPSNE